MAVTMCVHCRDTRPITELRAYVRAPGIVLRCPSRGGVEVRLVQSTDRAWLDLRGIQVLQIPASAKLSAVVRMWGVARSRDTGSCAAGTADGAQTRDSHGGTAPQNGVDDRIRRFMGSFSLTSLGSGAGMT